MSWFASQPSSTSSTSQQSNTWNSWTDPVKWAEFAAKTQQEALKLAETTQLEAAKLADLTQKEAVKLAGVTQQEALKFAEIAQEKAAELSKHANNTRNHYDPNDISSSILYGLGIPMNPTTPVKRNVTVDQIDFTYITENIVAMPFPADCRRKKCPVGMNDILDVSSYLESYHKGHYMILNISEDPYDYSLFDNQVLEYHFPGHPAPPLGVLFKICVAVESWLDADERNIAVIHCLTGKGRTASLISCILAWMGEFSSPIEALHYICGRKNTTVEILTIPSQRRYIQYFGNMLDGIKPRSEPILLRRVIMSSIPKFERKITQVVKEQKEAFLDIQGTSQVVEQVVDTGCAPYIQLFKCGNLIATATPLSAGSEVNHHSGNNANNLTLSWINSVEGSTSFTVNAAIRGDILLRCRHADSSGASGVPNGRISMFRAAFHTGYVPAGVLRLTKDQLDGAGYDSRFDEDFFIDLIFAPIVKVSGHDDAANTNTNNAAGGNVITTNKNISDEGIEVIETSEKYEQTLHKDARFWESIANRKLKAKRRKPRKFTADRLDHFIIDLSASSLAAEEEVNIDATWKMSQQNNNNNNNTTSSSSSSSSSSSKPTSTNLISDEDLIAQLAYAEQLLGENESMHGEAESEGGGEEGRRSPVLVMTPSQPRGVMNNPTADTSSFHGIDTTDLSPMIATNPVSATTTNTLSAQKELQALEALERELGLGELNIYTPVSNSTYKTATNDDYVSISSRDLATEGINGGSGGGGLGGLPVMHVQQDDEDVDVDELEQYLQSISNSNNISHSSTTE